MKKTVLFISALVVTFITLYASQQVFRQVTIGDLVWMGENLNVDKFQNGDPIPQAKSTEEWLEAGKKGTPAWCYLNNDPINGERYGKLYNWYAVNDPRGLAPEGWRVATEQDWKQLVNQYGGIRNAGGALKSRSGWARGNGSNESGFNGLPGGMRKFNGDFDFINHDSYWWTSTEYDNRSAYFHHLSHMGSQMGDGEGPKLVGLYVRCVKN